jgi:CheY-like chemotaxis protein/anti-sigma regulatory factor (Ser/Thr protein kinase)
MAKDASPSDSTVAHDLDKVLQAGNRAADLVRQILAFSRQADTERVPLEPSSIVNEAIKLLRSTLPSTIAIKSQINGTKPILADPTQVHQILINLCTNAYHAMEQTGGLIDISLKDCELSREELLIRPDMHPGSFVELTIGDSGPGIAPEVRDKIFEPYFTTKETGKGTGLGLSIVHGIVKNYGGFIACESAPGKGAVFHVLFPAIRRESVPAIQTVEAVQYGREHILFIDDEEILVEMGRAMLERLGYEVTVRTSSLEALTTFKNQPDRFDVVITDQTMPGMTGTDLARRMLQIRSDLPIILCTGYSSLIDEDKAKACGIRGFALKPMTKKDIATLLRQVLNSNFRN